MAYKQGERNQQVLFPQSIEDYVGKEDVVRGYDAMIDALDIEATGLKLDYKRVGAPAYDPKSMLKLLVYGYSYGIRSSRKLERECHYNVSFIWLTGGLKPDHKTIAEFRKNNAGVLKSVLRETAKIAMKLGLIEGNTLFIDGSKIRGNASVENSWTKERAEETLNKIDDQISEIIKECEEIDQAEANSPSLIKLKKELGNKEELKSSVEKIVKEIKDNDKNNHNTTDQDSVRLNSTHGIFAGYNVQSVVDEKHGLIVSVDTISQNNDSNQLTPQLKNAEEVLGKKCEVVCADSGYSSLEDLVNVDKNGIRVVVPSTRQAFSEKKELSKYSNINFKYNAEKDCMVCPEGQELAWYSNGFTRKVVKYKAHKKICNACKFESLCTTSKNGRSVDRSLNQNVKERLEAQYKEPENQAIYRLRKQKAELPFAHIKKNLKLDSFLLRGKSKVLGEISILAACFNIIRMINYFGIDEFKQKLMTIPN